MFQPARPSAIEQASPNPDEAPRTRAQRSAVFSRQSGGILVHFAHRPRDERPSETPGEPRLLAALLFLLAVVWLEPAGSVLAEPDETRYAEIPREMLAAGDLVVPRLNGVPYFEKPPLLYWVNAASLRVFGETPWAARLPTRLAGLGTLLLVSRGRARDRSRRPARAAVLFLAAPIGFLFSRTNLTDGLLTFFFTATLLAGRAAVLRREEKRPWLAMSAIFGAAACAAAFLTKGLIALVLPAAIFFIWAVATRTLRRDAPHARALAPAPLVFLASGAAVVSRWSSGGIPGFSTSSSSASTSSGSRRRRRNGPGPSITSFRSCCSASCPACAFFARGVLESPAREPTRRSSSSSGSRSSSCSSRLEQQAAALSLPRDSGRRRARRARDAGRPEPADDGCGSSRRSSRPPSPSASSSHPELRAAARELRLEGIIAPRARHPRPRVLVRGPLRRQRSEAGSDVLGFGWGAFLLAVVLGWPKTPQARFTAELADGRAPGRGALARQGHVVGLQGLPERHFMGAEDSHPGRGLPGRARARVRDARGGAGEPVLERRAVLGGLEGRAPGRGARAHEGPRRDDDRGASGPRRALERPPRHCGQLPP